MQGHAGSRIVATIVDQSTRNSLVAFASRYSGAAEDAEDVVQDALIAAMRFEGECVQPIPWLRRIVLNECRMRFRARGRIRRGGDVPHVPYHDEVASECALDPEAALVEREMWGRLEDGMKTLRPCERDALDRYVTDGLSVAEIAREVGTTRQAIKSRMFRARRSLVEAMAR
jgi:RNA polymerase sigma-70 factor (ECF subfamily)